MNAKQREHVLAHVQVQEARKKIEALRALFDAFIFANDGAEADKIRLQLHTLIDIELDHSSRATRLLRELMEDPPLL